MKCHMGTTSFNLPWLLCPEVLPNLVIELNSIGIKLMLFMRDSMTGMRQRTCVISRCGLVMEIMTVAIL